MTQVFRPVDVRLQGTGNLTGLFKRRILPATTAEGLNTAVLNFFNAVPASICIVEGATTTYRHPFMTTQRV